MHGNRHACPHKLTDLDFVLSLHGMISKFRRSFISNDCTSIIKCIKALHWRCWRPSVSRKPIRRGLLLLPPYARCSSQHQAARVWSLTPTLAYCISLMDGNTHTHTHTHRHTNEPHPEEDSPRTSSLTAVEAEPFSL